MLLVVLYHLYAVKMPLSDFTSTAMGLEHMFGKIKTFTISVFLIPLFFLISNAVRMYWFTMHQGERVKIPFYLYFIEARAYVLHSVTHKKLRECPEKIRWPKHWRLALGCTMMFVILFFFLRWFQTDNLYPIYHPQRWLGYLATFLIVIGSIDILIGRIKKEKEIYKFSELEDFIFPILLLATAVSGIAVHIFRYLGLELLTHYTYAIHLVIAVPMLVVEIPFGKLSHMIYRPLAIYFQTVKEKARQKALPESAVLEQA